MSSKKIRTILLFLAIFAILGYFREFFFVHINVILYIKYYHTPNPQPIPDMMKVFENFSYDALYYSKYPFTIIWSLIFLTTNYFCLRMLTGNSSLIKILVYTYLGIFVLAFLSMTYGYFINQRLQSDEYTLSRWLLGIAQSPLICLILLASEKLYRSSQHTTEPTNPH